MLSLRSAHSLVLISILAARAIQSSIAFAPSSIQIRPLSHSAMTTQRASSNPEDEKEEGIPCLPPIGESSYTGEPTLNDDSETLRIGSEKFELQYTCKVCETRNFHKVSRMAYRNGIVITVCKGCLSKHLIADNLGWTKYLGGFNGDSNIEEYMQTHGRADEVNRVTREVFDLEGILKNNANNIFDLEGILENNSSSDDLDTGAERSFE